MRLSWRSARLRHYSAKGVPESLSLIQPAYFVLITDLYLFLKRTSGYWVERLPSASVRNQDRLFVMSVRLLRLTRSIRFGPALSPRSPPKARAGSAIRSHAQLWLAVDVLPRWTAAVIPTTMPWLHSEPKRRFSPLPAGFQTILDFTQEVEWPFIKISCRWRVAGVGSRRKNPRLTYESPLYRPLEDSTEKPAIYHCVSRVVDRRFAFGPGEPSGAR